MRSMGKASAMRAIAYEAREWPRAITLGTAPRLKDLEGKGKGGRG
jgi:hypothetical protein